MTTPRQNDLEYIRSKVSAIPTKKRNLYIDEFVQGIPVPRGPRRGQKHDNATAPYMIEIMRIMSPQSSVREVYGMFSAQVSKSYTQGSIGVYYTKTYPSEILYVSGTDESKRRWMEREYEVRAQSLGIEFRAATQDPTARKKGNQVASKLFPGGNIDGASAQSINQLSSDTKRILLPDELDRWVEEMGKEKARYSFDNMKARGQAWGDELKLFGVSTPIDVVNSLIFELYQTGDQCFYNVPCPLCGKLQKLVLARGDGHGLTWKTKSDVVIRNTVEYVCEFCAGAFKEYHKKDITNAGLWIPTAPDWKSLELPEPLIRSFQLNAIYSQLKKWVNIAEDYTTMDKRNFTTLVMGMPYVEKGSRPSLDTVCALRGDYKSGQVPDGIIFTVIGADIQSGAQKYVGLSDDDLDNIILREIHDATIHDSDLPRIELEILGIGFDTRTYSLMYIQIFGRTNNHMEGAFSRMREMGEQGKFTLQHKGGRQYAPKRIFIDAGDGANSGLAVLSFCSEWPGCYPVRGRGRDSMKNKSSNSYKPFDKTTINDNILYNINVDMYKDRIYDRLKIPREGNYQRPGFCDFPVDYSDYYFKMLTAEEKKVDGSYDAQKRRNEGLDCRVYSMCASDSWLFDEQEKLKKAYQKAGKPQKVIDMIDFKFVLDILSAKIGVTRLK